MSGEIGTTSKDEATNEAVPGTGLEPADPERIKRMAKDAENVRAAMETLGRSLKVAMEDFEALRKAISGDDELIVHACPPGTSGIMPCCGKGPMDVPLTQPIRTDPNAVTCRGALA